MGKKIKLHLKPNGKKLLQYVLVCLFILMLTSCLIKPACAYEHIYLLNNMSGNILAGYKEINLEKDDYMSVIGVSVNVDVSRALCRPS